MGNGSRFARWVVGLVIPLAAASSTYAADAPTISTLSGWTLETYTQYATATMRLESGAMRFDITRKPSADWYVQAYQNGRTVRDGSLYTLRFVAKASTNRAILFTMQTDSSPWRSVIDPPPAINLTTQWKTHSVRFRIKDAQGATVRLPQFLLGQAVGTVWIKNIVITNAAGAPIAMEPEPPGPSYSGRPSSGWRPDPPTTAPSDPDTPQSTNTPESPDTGILGPPPGWQVQCYKNAEAATELADDVVQANITRRGAERWNVQLYQTPANLVARRPYILTVCLRSDAPRKVTFIAQRDEEPYDAVLPYTDLDVGPEWTQYKLKFTLNKVYPAHTRLAFQIGDAKGMVELRAASLVEGPRK